MTYRDVQYGQSRVPRTDFPERLARMLRDSLCLPLQASLLDVGCGRGDFTDGWRSVGMRAVGMDREAPADLVGDVNSRFPAEDCSFDVVFSKSLLEHLPSPTNMLAESFRVLKPGGVLILMTPDWRTYMLTFFDDYTHVRPYDVVSSCDLLRSVGFSYVSSELVYQYPAQWSRPWLSVLFWLWRNLVPLRAALALHRLTGWGWPKWACQLTVLAVGRKS